MTFKQDLTNDLTDVFFNKVEFAEDATTVTYHPASGSPYEVAVIFDREFESVDPNTEQAVISTQPVARINENDLVAEVKKGDKITVRGQKYLIIKPETDGVGTIFLFLNKEIT